MVDAKDSCAASSLTAQDNIRNTLFSGISLYGVQLVGTAVLASGANFTGAFTTSGRTITAASSGLGWGPAGFLTVQVSGNNVVVPFFNP